jgi:hypothetical protein
MMSIAIQIATLVTTLIGFGGMIFAVWSFRKTLHANVMMTYAERFAKLMDNLPREIFLPSVSNQPLSPLTPEQKLTCLKYFNLTLEEFYLWKKGYFPKDLWQVWEGDIRKLLADPLMRLEWGNLKDSFKGDKDFSAFVEESQNPQKTKTD